MKKRVAAILIVALLAGGIFFLLQNKQTFSDEDLRYTRPTLADGENGYALLEQAREQLAISKSEIDQLSRQLHGEEWDPRVIDPILASNEEALRLFRQVHGLRVLVPESPTLWIDYDSEELVFWKTLASLSMADARKAFHAGNEPDSFEHLLNLAEIAHQLEDAGGVKIHYLVACSMKQLAIRQMTNLIAQTTLPCEQLLGYASRLEKIKANTTGLTNVFKMQYRVELASVAEWHRGRVPGVTNANYQFGAATAAKVLMSAQKSREMHAKIARLSLESAVQPYGGKSFDSITNLAEETSATKLLLSGNALGQILAGMTLQSQDNFFGRKATENVEVSATRLLLILRCYEMRNGTLPKSLNDLVPKYLSTVPLDDFDGVPLRYSGEKRVIYSVGADLIDSGGQERDAKKKILDRVFPISKPRLASPK